jgi:hypothetical protein
MRLIATTVAAFVILAPALPAAAMTCETEIPAAQSFLDKLRPGPNTTAAQRHLDAARRATSADACVAELRQVDKYARRSQAADRRAAAPRDESQAADQRAAAPRDASQAADQRAVAPREEGHGTRRSAARVQCADFLHQARPGGSDYHGPPVPGCPAR